MTGLKSACSLSSPSPSAVRNLPGRNASGVGSSVTRNGASVNRVRYSAKYGTCRSTRNSRKITCPIAIASAPSVPGAGDSHSSANLAASE